MSRPREVTDTQLEAARASQARRRALIAQLRAIPTLRQYAQQWGCTVRHAWRALAR